jgi:WD40 repeat protein
MFRLRFSLSTLIIATFFVGAVYRIWWRGFDAWTCERTYQTGKRLLGSSSQYNVAALSSDMRLLAATNSEEKLRLFSVQSGETIWSLDLAGSLPRHQLRFLDDNRVIEDEASNSRSDIKKVTYFNARDGTNITDVVRLKQLAKLSSETEPLHGFAPFSSVASPDGSRMLLCERPLSIESDATYKMRLANPKTGEVIAELPSTFAPCAMHFSPDGERFASGTFRQVTVCSSGDGRLLRTLETNRWNLFLEFSADSQYLAVVHTDCVSLWKRHWPETWWGHFYRVEVWMTIVAGAVLILRMGRVILPRPQPVPKLQVSTANMKVWLTQNGN